MVSNTIPNSVQLQLHKKIKVLKPKRNFGL